MERPLLDSPFKRPGLFISFDSGRQWLIVPPLRFGALRLSGFLLRLVRER